MSLSTHSKIYYGYEVDATNNKLSFAEGVDPELIAELSIGSYTLTELVAEISRALNETEDVTLTYTVSVNRSTRRITIAATGTFSLLVSTGLTFGTSVFGLAGFTGADRTGAATYLGNIASGTSYSTQFILQSHIPLDSIQGAADGVVNKSASGKVEVVTFGEENFMKANFKYVTNRNMSQGAPVRNNPTGYEELVALMQYFVSKGPFEFMADENDSSTFEKLMLESTPQDSKGLKYELKENYDRGLPGFFETGTLTFRRVT